MTREDKDPISPPVIHSSLDLSETPPETPRGIAQATSDDAWQSVSAAESLHAEGVEIVAKAWQDERKRCADIITDEIAKGLTAGIPKTSGTMRILYRIDGAIRNGG